MNVGAQMEALRNSCGAFDINARDVNELPILTVRDG